MRYWVLAARPKTLAASVMPVLLACALTYKEEKFNFIPALLCFVFALLAQIVSNFLNDYYDFIKGSDRNDRLGPERAVSKGWISPKVMLNTSILLIIFACLLGCILIYYAGWKLIFVGIGVALGVFAYSAGPYPLAYKGWGDICVLIFYGIIPVGFTYYVQTLAWSPEATIAGFSIGIVTVNILVANNYRDREQDKISGKNTTIVIFGEEFGRYFYLFNGIIAVLICLFFYFTGRKFAALIPLLYLFPHILTWKEMCDIRQGKELNKILGKSARNTIIFGLLLILGIVIG